MFHKEMNIEKSVIKILVKVYTFDLMTDATFLENFAVGINDYAMHSHFTKNIFS